MMDDISVLLLLLFGGGQGGDWGRVGRGGGLKTVRELYVTSGVSVRHCYGFVSLPCVSASYGLASSQSIFSKVLQILHVAMLVPWYRLTVAANAGLCQSFSILVTP